MTVRFLKLLVLGFVALGVVLKVMALWIGNSVPARAIIHCMESTILGVIIGAITALSVQWLASCSNEKQNEKKRKFESGEARRIHRIERLEELFVEFREWSSIEHGGFALLDAVDRQELSLDNYQNTILEEISNARGDKNRMFMLAKSYGNDVIELEDVFDAHAKLIEKQNVFIASYKDEKFIATTEARKELNQSYMTFLKLSADIELEISNKIRTLS